MEFSREDLQQERDMYRAAFHREMLAHRRTREALAAVTEERDTARRRAAAWRRVAEWIFNAGRAGDQ